MGHILSLMFLSSEDKLDVLDVADCFVRITLVLSNNFVQNIL